MPESRFLDVGRAPPQDVPLYLRAFDVCAMPHPATTQFARYTSPLKLFEYMAAGCAIVASDLPGWADVLADGETAILAPPDDIAAWSVAIDSLRRDPELRRRLGTAAQAQAMAHFTWAIRAERDHLAYRICLTSRELAIPEPRLNASPDQNSNHFTPRIH